MQITSRFTIAVHIITATDHFKDTEAVTSRFLAGSVGVNPVVVRQVMSMLKDAGIIVSSQGRSGVLLARDLSDITFFDVYQAVDCVGETGLFHFHEHPSTECEVGRNIHYAMDKRLREVQNAMEDKLRSITLADVASDIEREIGLQG